MATVRCTLKCYMRVSESSNDILNSLLDKQIIRSCTWSMNVDIVGVMFDPSVYAT